MLTWDTTSHHKIKSLLSLSVAATSLRWWPRFRCRSLASLSPSSNTPTGSSPEVRADEPGGFFVLIWLMHWKRPAYCPLFRNWVQRHRELRQPGPRQPQRQLQLHAVTGYGAGGAETERPEPTTAQRRHGQHDAGVLQEGRVRPLYLYWVCVLTHLAAAFRDYMQKKQDVLS